MTTARTQVLDHGQVRQRIRRMAFQIYENNFTEKSVIVAGIDGQGYALAREIASELMSVSPIKATLARVFINKETPEKGEVTLDMDAGRVKKQVVILVDDVLNSGRTLAYGMKPFLSMEVKKIEVAVLVNRSHPKFPIQPQYTGYELSTTLSEHVTVVLGDKSVVYLH